MTKPGALPFSKQYNDGAQNAPRNDVELDDTVARLIHTFGELTSGSHDTNRTVVAVLGRPELREMLQQMVDKAVANRQCDLHLDHTRVVHRTFNWFGALIGAVLGVVVGLIVNYFLNPTTVLNLLPGGGELLFSPAVDQWWFQVLVIIVGVLTFGILGGFIFARRTYLLVLTDAAARSHRYDSRRPVQA